MMMRHLGINGRGVVGIVADNCRGRFGALIVADAVVTVDMVITREPGLRTLSGFPQLLHATVATATA